MVFFSALCIWIFVCPPLDYHTCVCHWGEGISRKWLKYSKGGREWERASWRGGRNEGKRERASKWGWLRRVEWEGEEMTSFKICMEINVFIYLNVYNKKLPINCDLLLNVKLPVLVAHRPSLVWRLIRILCVVTFTPFSTLLFFIRGFQSDILQN